MERVDDIDKRIIRILSEDSRTSLREIGKKVSLTAGAVRSRIIRLMNRGVIERFTIDVNWRRIGYEIQAVILITSRPGSSSALYERLCTYDEMTRVYWTTGPATFICITRLRDMTELSEFMTRELERLDGIEKIETLFLMPTS